MDTLKEEKEGLEELIANNQDKMDQLTAKVSELESSLESCSVAKSELEADRGRMLQQIASYEDEAMSQSDADMKSAAEKLAHLESANADLNLQVSTLRKSKS
jgi:chromosome segregation ATPase